MSKKLVSLMISLVAGAFAIAALTQEAPKIKAGEPVKKEGPKAPAVAKTAPQKGEAAPQAKPASPAEEKAKAMMEAYQKASMPDENHAFLKQMGGMWDVEAKAWMGPGEPVISKGQASILMILDGRFLRQIYRGKLMGQQFDGFGLTGYDKQKKKFVSVWLDTMGTGIMSGTGSLDETKTILTTEYTYTDSLSGEEKKSRDVLRIVEDGKFITEMFEPGPDGKEVKVMENIYTRKATPPVPPSGK